ncbi:MAG: hypothetical protein V4477_16820 [Pseudomonadota bacterium]
MPTKFIPDSGGFDYQDGLEPHYYENQVPSPGPLGEYTFERAAARAKDKARHQFVKRVRAERDRVRTERGVFQEFGMILSGQNPGKTDVTMTVDGAAASSDDAIKL